MSLAAAIRPAEEHLDEPDDARVRQLRAWLRRARSRAMVVYAELQHARAEADRVEAALAMAERDLEGGALQ